MKLYFDYRLQRALHCVFYKISDLGLGCDLKCDPNDPSYTEHFNPISIRSLLIQIFLYVFLKLWISLRTRFKKTESVFLEQREKRAELYTVCACVRAGGLKKSSELNVFCTLYFS